MKRFIAFLTSLFILLSLTISVYAVDGLPYIVDDADLISADEEATLDAYLESESKKLNFDIVVLTVDSLDGKTAEEYADDYYDYNGYGYGESHDGCLLLVAMDDREWHLSTTGYGITALTDAGIEYISNHFLDDLSNGDYINAFNMYAYLVSTFVEQAKTGDAYNYNNLNEYDPYYDVDDYYSDGDNEQSFGIVVLAGLVGGVVVAIIVVSILKSKMKTVYHKAQANDYLVNDSLKITGAHDIFITKHVSRTSRESSSGSGGSSTHSGSSGTSHGGGGGRF